MYQRFVLLGIGILNPLCYLIFSEKMRSSVLLVGLLLEATYCFARPQHAQVVGRDAKLKDTYDFVIVGGGTSGLTVADRLTENPDSKFPSRVAFGCPSVLHMDADV